MVSALDIVSSLDGIPSLGIASSLDSVPSRDSVLSLHSILYPRVLVFQWLGTLVDIFSKNILL